MVVGDIGGRSTDAVPIISRDHAVSFDLVRAEVELRFWRSLTCAIYREQTNIHVVTVLATVYSSQIYIDHT